MSLTWASCAHDEKSSFLIIFERFSLISTMRKHTFAGRNTQQSPSLRYLWFSPVVSCELRPSQQLHCPCLRPQRRQNQLSELELSYFDGLKINKWIINFWVHSILAIECLDIGRFTEWRYIKCSRNPVNGTQKGGVENVSPDSPFCGIKQNELKNCLLKSSF